MGDATDFLKLAGKHAVRAAEDYIQRSLFHQAVQSMKAAKDLDPKLSCMADNYIAAYTVLQAAHAKESLYKVLGVDDVKASGAEIKKRFRKMSLMVHPDKNGSVAAEEAFKHVLNALEVLSDDKKRLSYDYKMGYGSPPQQSQQQRARRAPPHGWNAPSSSSQADTKTTHPGFKKAQPQPPASSSSQADTKTTHPGFKKAMGELAKLMGELAKAKAMGKLTKAEAKALGELAKAIEVKTPKNVDHDGV